MTRNSDLYQEKRMRPRSVIDLPFDCRRVGGCDLRAGIVGNASDTGLLIYSGNNFPIGTNLIVTVFFPREFQLDAFEAIGTIVRKSLTFDEDGKSDQYDYGLKIIQIKEGELVKLRRIQEGAYPLPVLLGSVQGFPCPVGR